MFTPRKTRCQTCEELDDRMIALGKKYSGAVKEMWEKRGKDRDSPLSEAVDMAHLRFLEARAELRRHQVETDHADRSLAAGTGE